MLIYLSNSNSLTRSLLAPKGICHQYVKEVMKSFRKFLMFAGISAVLGHAQQTPLDKSLAPDQTGVVSSVFLDMGVVQRRAMPKGGRFLISNYGSFDFSDGPYSMYGVNLDLGYALSDFWELYLTSTPVFFSNARPIVAALESLDPPQTVDYTKPSYSYGGALVWAPAYGKDSLGSRRVIRSDTFFKLTGSQIVYEESETGLKFSLGVGKTYFLTKWLGLRVVATGSMIQTIQAIGEEATKKFRFFGIVETGFMFYL